MCNCLNEMEASLEKKTGDPDMRIQGIRFDFKNKCRALACCYDYREKTKKGEYFKIRTHEDFIYSYCPFCGKKY